MMTATTTNMFNPLRGWRALYLGGSFALRIASAPPELLASILTLLGRSERHRFPALRAIRNKIGRIRLI